MRFAAAALALALTTALSPIAASAQTTSQAATSQAAASQAVASQAAAAPEQIRVQVPGFYRFAVGDAVATAIYDGYIYLKNPLFKGASPEEFKAALDRMFVESAKEGGAQTAVNAYLIHDGERLALIDAGTAKAFGPTLGEVTANIRAAGYDPAQVSVVLLTHLHPDHANGLMTPEGKVAFPNADVWVAKAEADFWLNADIAAKAPEGLRPMFQMAQGAVAAYAAAGKLKIFAPGDALPVKGVSAVAAPGHTPGHTGYLLESKGEKLLVWGDVVHSHAAQFVNPDISLEFDTDQPMAIATRKKLLAETAAAKLLVAGAHLPFPGIGHVRNDGDGRYAWVPVEYAPLPAKP